MAQNYYNEKKRKKISFGKIIASPEYNRRSLLRYFRSRFSLFFFFISFCSYFIILHVYLVSIIYISLEKHIFIDIACLVFRVSYIHFFAVHFFTFMFFFQFEMIGKYFFRSQFQSQFNNILNLQIASRQLIVC